MKLFFNYLLRIASFLILTVIMGSLLFAGIGWYLLQNSQTWMTKLAQQAVNEKFPGWPISIGSAILDGDGRIRINGIIVRSPVYGDEMLRIPELQLEVDRKLFLEKQKISLQEVWIRNPVGYVVRREDLSWNIKELPPLPQQSNTPFPLIHIENGMVSCRLSTAHAPHEIVVNCEQINTSIKVDEQKLLQTTGKCLVGPAGELEYDVQYGMANKEYLINTKLPRTLVGNDLINLLLTFVPGQKQLISKLDTRNYLPHQQHQLNDVDQFRHKSSTPKNKGIAFQQVSQTTETRDTSKGTPQAEFGTELVLTASLEIASNGHPLHPEWKTAAQIQQGRIIHPALPFPLYSMTGDFVADNSGMKIKKFQASYGQTDLNVQGELGFPFKPLLDGIDVTLNQLMLDQRLRMVLPESMKRVYDELNVNGPCDLKVRIFPKEKQGFDWFLHSMTLKDCTGKLAKFPYPITQLNGVVRQDASKVSPTLLLFNLQGLAGQQPITARGGVVSPGPGYESIIDVGVKNVPIDDTLRNALPSSVRKTLEDMKLRGRADVVARLVRPPIEGKPFQIIFNSELRDGSMNWSIFPYDIKQLSGSLIYANDCWKFTNVKGLHDQTKLTAVGSFCPKDPLEVLNFKIHAQDGHFDQALQHALSSCGKSMTQLWSELNPSGTFNLDVTLSQQPAKKLEIFFNQLQTESAELMLKNFPYRLSGIKSTIKGPIQKLSIEKFQARNGQTAINGKAICEIGNERWNVRVDDFHVDDLLPDHGFRAAVAKPLRDAIEGLALKDRLSLSGGFTLSGSCLNQDEPVQATWNLETILTAIQLVAGLEFKNIHGKVETQGTYHPATGVVLTGKLRLDSLETNGYQILKVQGPFELQGEELVLGARRMFDSNTKELMASPPKPEERITGRLFDGIITVDAITLLNKQNPYRVRLTLTEGKLEKWAQASGYSDSDIRGNMNGWVDVQGDVNWKQTQVGRGRMWISPAEIYKLPILIRIFRALQFVPPDRTAFRYVFADFYVNGNQFLFDHIDLIGEAISLVGNGYISFDRRVALDFDSLIPRAQIPIPVINNLINSRFIRGSSKGIISVTVRGNLHDPEIKVDAGVPIVEEAVKNFMSTVERGTNDVLPLLVPPPQFSTPDPAQSRGKTAPRQR